MRNTPDQMWAVLLTGHGGFDKLKYCQVPTPKPAADEVLVRVGACGLNNTDINTRTAWYAGSVDKSIADGAELGFAQVDELDASWANQAIGFPRIQGADVVGVIEAVGRDVESSRIGERILIDPWILNNDDWQNPQTARYFGSEVDGGFAEFTKVRHSNAIPVLSNLSDAELATFPCAYTTAENLIERTGAKAGETVVISGASGGVGSAAIQICRARGCRVIAIASAAKTDRLVELGASVVIAREEKNLETAIIDAAGAPVDVSLDVVGADTFMPLINVLRHGGRYSSSGCIAGPLTEIDLRQLIYKDLQLTGATICPPGTMQKVVGMIEAGDIKPLLAETFALSELAAAQQSFLKKLHVGNVVVIP